MNHPPVYIGMDLGSFRTSIVCSNGRREELLSVVGWPKDHVARAMLGRDVVFCDEVVQHRLALNIVRPFEKGMLKYRNAATSEVPGDKVKKHRQAARLLVEHAVALMEPPEGAPVYGVLGAPSRADTTNKQFLLEAAQSAFDAVVIVPEPFTVAYGMNRLNETLVVDIGAGTIDICPMYGTFPADEEQVTIPVGGDAIDEKFYDLLRAQHPEVRLSQNMARKIKEKYAFVHDVNERVAVTVPTVDGLKEFDVSEPLRDACRTIVPLIVNGLKEMLASFDPEFHGSMLKNVLLAGGGSQIRGLDQLIEHEMRGFGETKVSRVYDQVFAGAAGALKMAMAMPGDYWQKIEKLDQLEEVEDVREAAA